MGYESDAKWRKVPNKSDKGSKSASKDIDSLQHSPNPFIPFCPTCKNPAFYDGKKNFCSRSRYLKSQFGRRHSKQKLCTQTMTCTLRSKACKIFVGTKTFRKNGIPHQGRLDRCWCQFKINMAVQDKGASCIHLLLYQYIHRHPRNVACIKS